MNIMKSNRVYLSILNILCFFFGEDFNIKILYGSILALIIWYEKKNQIELREYEHKTT